MYCFMETEHRGTVVAHDYDLYLTLSCGQCFSWRQIECSNMHVVQSRDSFCVCSQEGDRIQLSWYGPMLFDDWCTFFGFEDDISGVAELVKGNQWLTKAYAENKGIRILHQDAWQMLASAIVSQNNNIPRIVSSLEELCELNGRKIAYDPYAGEVYAFPTPEELSHLDLTTCHFGYRNAYLWDACRLIRSGAIDLSGLTPDRVPYSRVVSELLRINGVGPKVCACVGLFGLGFTEAVPRDVWIHRAMEAAGITEEDFKRYGKHAGLIQQYMYNEIRRA